MEERRWLLEGRFSERSPESSVPLSSDSEGRFCDQDVSEGTPNHNTWSAEASNALGIGAGVLDAVLDDSRDENPVKGIPSDRFQNHNNRFATQAISDGGEDNLGVKLLKEKLSAALLSVSLKDDLVKQHARVAEEAVAGWEKAENEVAVVKKQLETIVLQKAALEAQASHFDEALKECVQHLGLTKEGEQKKVNQVVAEKTHEWELIKSKLQDHLAELLTMVEASKVDSSAFMDLKLHNNFVSLEKENAALKMELLYQTEELEVRTIERDLSTRAAETACKQHLESIMKIAKLEAECRRLKAQSHKSPSTNELKSTAASSSCVESLTDSHSDNIEPPNSSDIENHKVNGMEPSESEPSCSDSWAAALMAELDRFKYEKVVSRRSLPSSPFEIDLMDDFAEMERLVSFQQFEHGGYNTESEAAHGLPKADSQLRNELETTICQISEMEEKIDRVEAEKAEIKMALAQSQSCLEKSQVQLIEAEMKLEQLEMELHEANESKQNLESQLNGARSEAQIMCAQNQSLQAQMDKEKALSAEMSAKCQAFEHKFLQNKQELELQQSALINKQMIIKQDGLSLAAGKLAECQKTISSLGNQLKSLATLEDFLIDSASIPGFSGDDFERIGSCLEIIFIKLDMNIGETLTSLLCAASEPTRGRGTKSKIVELVLGANGDSNSDDQQ
ncbi:hypothetical protein Nepgr_002543 [Nepenthes gracilis]|uniref:Filament-like plant protein n=1 Tax=Nepenthes gracilis TaxID=150966 RepID=A0AAD3P6G6_NEPGR|nr:hypothetical protein Nepgr_002543 [Nepenthes gracilis]